ncbi:hypothetical protein, partial [Aliidiomarina haloalkalitolerans]
GAFHHGFVSAGMGQVANNAGGDLATSVILGGTASQVVGGKFANGAVTAAFAWVLRAAHNGDAYRKSESNIYEDRDANNAERTVITLSHSNHKNKFIVLNISNELTQLIEALTLDASQLADAILGEFESGRHRVSVSANYRLHDAGLFNKDGITLNPNGFHGHKGVAQLVLGHELIHYRDHAVWGVSYSQRRSESEVNAYRWEINNAHSFILAESHLQTHIRDATTNCRLHGGCR